MKVKIIPIVIGAFGTVTKGLLKGLEDLEVGSRVLTIRTKALLENGQNTEKIPGDIKSIAENGQDPETSPGDLRRLAVSQTPVKNNQVTLMWKTLKE